MTEHMQVHVSRAYHTIATCIQSVCSETSLTTQFRVPSQVLLAQTNADIPEVGVPKSGYTNKNILL